MEEKAKGSFWKAALIYGAILGFIGILIGVIFYVLNAQFKGWTQLVSIIISIAVLTYCLKAYRDEYLGGFASYGKLLTMILGIAVVATILSLIYTYILVGIIDVDYIEKAKQFQIERFSQNPRLSEAQLETIIDRIENNEATITKILIQAGIFGIIVTFIIGLIVSAFIKKVENPVSNAV